MDRCVVLVDAGYLLGAAASLLAGDPSRSRISVDHATLVRQLRERAEAETAQPLLRIYWFDGAPDRVPQPEHRRLRVMPRVTVRLGALTRSDGRWAQKGVDAAMHAELTELARNKACSDIVLVTGDGDLLPGMTAAKEHGVAVHLWAVQAAGGDYNQSEDLVAEADERRLLDRAWITRAIRARDTAGTCAPQPAPGPEIAAILSAPLPDTAARPARDPEPEHTPAPAETNGTAAGTARAVPTPKDLAALRAADRPPRQGAARHRHPAVVLRQGARRTPGPRRLARRHRAAHPRPAHHGRTAVGRPRGGHHHRRRRPLRGRPGLRPPLALPPRRPHPAAAPRRALPAHPAPHRRRAAALRRPVRPPRPQGRPDRRTRPVRDPGRVLARDRPARHRPAHRPAPLQSARPLT
ncbi:NYN domain-containing protein [Actinomadura keratinilytica]